MQRFYRRLCRAFMELLSTRIESIKGYIVAGLRPRRWGGGGIRFIARKNINPRSDLLIILLLLLASANSWDHHEVGSMVWFSLTFSLSEILDTFWYFKKLKTSNTDYERDVETKHWLSTLARWPWSVNHFKTINQRLVGRPSNCLIQCCQLSRYSTRKWIYDFNLVARGTVHV